MSMSRAMVRPLSFNLIRSMVVGETMAEAPDSLLYGLPLKVGYAGDSIAGFWSNSNGSSPLWWAATELYPCDYVNHMDTAVGGTSSSHLISNQIATLEALSVKPDVVIVCTTQNDYIGSYANAETFFDYLKTYSERALTAGVSMVVLCAHPPDSADDEDAVAYLNRLIEIYCFKTTGNFFCDLMSVWKQATATDVGGISYRGTANTADSFSDDGVHPTALATRAAAPLILPVLQRYARPVEPLSSIAAPYDDQTAPYSNVLDQNGNMIGTSGQLNGVNNAGVAGNSTSTYDRWYLTDENGITVTPTIVTGDDGYRYQSIALSGTATADAEVRLRYQYVKDVALGDYTAEALINCQSVQNIKNIGIKVTSIGNATTNFSNNLIEMDINTELHTLVKVEGFSNSGFSGKFFDVVIEVENGVTPSGTVLVGRCGITRTDESTHTE